MSLTFECFRKPILSHYIIQWNLNSHDLACSFCNSSTFSYAQYCRAGGYPVHVYLASIVVFLAFLVGIEAHITFISRLSCLIVVSNKSDPHGYFKK